MSDEEQKRRFQARINDLLRQWKLSAVDLPSRGKWFEYSRARDMMLEATDTEVAPWYILRADDKRRAPLNDAIPHEEVPREKVKLPEREMHQAYDDQATLERRRFVRDIY